MPMNYNSNSVCCLSRRGFTRWLDDCVGAAKRDAPRRGLVAPLGTPAPAPTSRGDSGTSPSPVPRPGDSASMGTGVARERGDASAGTGTALAAGARAAGAAAAAGWMRCSMRAMRSRHDSGSTAGAAAGAAAASGRLASDGDRCGARATHHAHAKQTPVGPNRLTFKHPTPALDLPPHKTHPPPSHSAAKTHAAGTAATEPSRKRCIRGVGAV